MTAILTGCYADERAGQHDHRQATSDVKTIFAKVLGFDSFDRPCHCHRLLPVLGEAARHHDRARPHGLHVPVLGRLERSGLHRPQQRAGGDQDVPAADESPVPSRRAGSAAAVDRDDANAQCSPPSPPARGQLRLGDQELSAWSPLSSDFASPPGTLNTGSTLVDRVECQQVGGGRTGYAGAIDAAQTELRTTDGPACRRC